MTQQRHRERDGRRAMEFDVVARHLLPREGEGATLGIVGTGMEGAARGSSTAAAGAPGQRVRSHLPKLCFPTMVISGETRRGIAIWGGGLD